MWRDTAGAAETVRGARLCIYGRAVEIAFVLDVLFDGWRFLMSAGWQFHEY